LRILYSHRVQSRDGQGVHIEELLNALRNAGHEVLVVGPGAYQKAELGGESAIIAGIRRILPSALIELAEIFYNIPTSLRLWRACKTFRPDFIYERYNLYHLAGVLTKWRGHVPLYLEVNAPLAEERKRFGNLKLGYLAKMLEHLVWRSADRVFVVTEVLKETVAGTGVERGRITVIPNGVDRDVFPAVPYRPRPGAPIVIGFIGFVRDWHGLDGVIAGLAQPFEPPIHLTIVGDGPARPSLERQAKALGVEGQVKFFGVKQRASIPDLIQRFDIALQPQAVSYASPLKLFEYMAAGRAIVAPDQPNIREILSGDETAILFDPRDPAALWCAIRRLAANPELRERLGRAARLALNAHDYTWQANAGRVIAAVAGDLGAQSVSVSDGPALDLPVRREPR
jgi:glycosyltransferase involved in cell wall biosynthesis